jgi:hypothetical protein
MFCIMIDLAYPLHCIIMLSAHAFAYSLDHVEPELEVQAERAQVEEFTNLSLDQGKPGASNHYP